MQRFLSPSERFKWGTYHQISLSTAERKSPQNVYLNRDGNFNSNIERNKHNWQNHSLQLLEALCWGDQGVTSRVAGAQAVQTPARGDSRWRGHLWETQALGTWSAHGECWLWSEGPWRVKSGGHEACAPQNITGAGKSVEIGHALPLTSRGSETRNRTEKMKLVVQGNTEAFSTAKLHDREKERATYSAKSEARSPRVQKPPARERYLTAVTAEPELPGPHTHRPAQATGKGRHTADGSVPAAAL